MPSPLPGRLALAAALAITAGAPRPVAAQPTTIAELGDGNVQLALGDHDVFLSSGWLVTALPKTGGSIHWVAFPEHSACALVHAGGRIYWTESSTFRHHDGRIMSADAGLVATKTSHPDRVHARGLDGPDSVIIDGDQVFWLDSQRGEVSTQRGRGPRRRLGDAGKGLSYAHHCANRLAADDAYLYFVRVPEVKDYQAPRASIVRVPRGGGRAEVLATGQRDPEDLAVDDRWVYWATRPWPNQPGSLLRAPKRGGKPQVLAAGLDAVSPPLLAGPYLYWIDRPYTDGYTVRRMRRDGGPITTLYRSKRRGHGLAIDDTHLYWIESGHLPGECHTEYRGCGENPMPPETVCTGPDARLLALPR